MHTSVCLALFIQHHVCSCTPFSLQDSIPLCKYTTAYFFTLEELGWSLDSVQFVSPQQCLKR